MKFHIVRGLSSIWVELAFHNDHNLADRGYGVEHCMNYLLALLYIICILPLTLDRQESKSLLTIHKQLYKPEKQYFFVLQILALSSNLQIKYLKLFEVLFDHLYAT